MLRSGDVAGGSGARCRVEHVVGQPRAGTGVNGLPAILELAEDQICAEDARAGAQIERLVTFEGSIDLGGSEAGGSGIAAPRSAPPPFW